jgi:hypothetical protein
LRKIKLVDFGLIFLSSVVTITALIFIVYLTGLRDHRTLYENSLIIATGLGVATFVLMTTGLYYGWRMKGKQRPLKDYIARTRELKAPEVNFDGLEGLGFPSGEGDGEGCVLSIVAGIILSGLAILIIWLAGLFFLGALIAIGGVIYWIIWNAFRLVFRNSPRCRNNLFLSIRIALMYCCIYYLWLYGIILIGHWVM